jgi:hypothetical protein
MDFPYHPNLESSKGFDEEVLDAISQIARSTPKCLGICVCIRTAHGYIGQDQFVQFEDGTAQYTMWIESNLPVTSGNTKLDVDLERVLEFVLTDIGKQRTENDEADRGTSSLRGRGVHLYVATKDRRAGIWCRRPDKNEDKDVLDLLLLAMDSAHMDLHASR